VFGHALRDQPGVNLFEIVNRLAGLGVDGEVPCRIQYLSTAVEVRQGRNQPGSSAGDTQVIEDTLHLQVILAPDGLFEGILPFSLYRAIAQGSTQVGDLTQIDLEIGDAQGPKGGDGQ